MREREIRNDECVESSTFCSAHDVVVHKGNVRHSNEMSPDSYQKGILVEMDTKVSDWVEISRLDYM